MELINGCYKWVSLSFFSSFLTTIVQQIIWIDCQIDSFENRAKRYQKCRLYDFKKNLQIFFDLKFLCFVPYERSLIFSFFFLFRRILRKKKEEKKWLEAVQ